MRGAAEDCRRKGIAFLPLVVESLGGWHTAAEAEVKKLGVVLARQTGQEEGEVLRHLWGRLGLLLQRGNAAILGNRLPTHPHPAVDGFHGFGNILALAEASIIEGLGASRINPREIVTFCCQEAVEGMCGHAKTVEQGRPQGQNLRSVLSTLLLD